MLTSDLFDYGKQDQLKYRKLKKITIKSSKNPLYVYIRVYIYNPKHHASCECPEGVIDSFPVKFDDLIEALSITSKVIIPDQ